MGNIEKIPGEMIMSVNIKKEKEKQWELKNNDHKKEQE